MKTIKNLLVVILPAVLIMSLFSCKKDTVKTNKNSKIQVGATTLSSFTDPLTVSLYAGVETHDYGNLDGPRLLARFASPYGITSTPTGALYITDGANNNIRKISPEGIVSTIPFSKQFANPYSITTASDGTVYFLEAGRQRIRKIQPDGRYDYVYPAFEICKIVDGVRIPYVFTNLFDFTVAPDGTIYLVDAGTHTIIKRATNGIATVFAGGTAGYKDGNGTDAQFNTPTNITIDASGNLYVTDLLNFRIRKITPDGTVTTLAGSTKGFTDGIGSSAQLISPQDVVVADSNTLLVADGYAIRSIDLTTNQVTTIAGGATSGYVNGPALSARFSFIGQITVHNNDIYASEAGFRYIRKISPL
jgi:sugar lactone lactonase YvrE